ncbi:Ubiquitin carboxyl-terminal hydrolase isozyme L3 [Phytophthora nicotianae]|uniref:Ubiquitin carboxyl-terminal hydrolase isozyme L3 n=1 Tax=Phytophthora nicotianae TaxID=4792 RepID=A0A0W8DGQ6_PHYNI|nr:Ubiquitin carboxyl-terminal hydrolase isozyme L3 [Phytophthora nicotianae]
MEDSCDDVSETESAESSQSGAPYLRRQQSCPSVQRKGRLDTQPESESDAESAPRPALKAVYSFARAGLTSSSKLFLVKPRHTPKTPSGSTPRKPHSRSVDAVSDQDLTTKSAGARVATPFGLGKIMAIRGDDGVAAIELQASGLLFLNATELEKTQVVPALVGERVHTPSGSGRVLKYDIREQLYTLRLGAGGGLGEYELQLRPEQIPPGTARDHQVWRRAYPLGGPAARIGTDSARMGAVAYLNADMIDFYPKALEGTDVQTKFGSGIVIGLRPADAIYTVRLHDPQPAGKSDVVFVHESDLHRSRRIVVTAANVRDRLKAMAQRRFGERIVVAHQNHDEEPNSAGI